MSFSAIRRGTHIGVFKGALKAERMEFILPFCEGLHKE
jgi:hypothetical protein